MKSENIAPFWHLLIIRAYKYGCKCSGCKIRLQKVYISNFGRLWALQIFQSCIYLSPFSQGLSVEVLPASWLSGHEGDRGCPARKTQADPGLRAAHEHHRWRHHRSAFHQKQGDSCVLSSLFSFSLSYTTSVIFVPLPAAPLAFVFLTHRVLAIDISSCFMLFQIFLLEQCRDFHKAKYVKCILNINRNACWRKTWNGSSQGRLSFYYVVWTYFCSD